MGSKTLYIVCGMWFWGMSALSGQMSMIEWLWLGQLAERMGTTAIAWHDTVEGCQKAATLRALIDG